MKKKKIDDSVIDAEDIIGLGLLKNHTHFIMGEIDDEITPGRATFERTTQIPTRNAAATASVLRCRVK